jgi:arginyl-tRNA synthetase
MQKTVFDTIIDATSKELTTLGVHTPNVVLDFPNPVFGDISLNVAMMYAKELSQKPHDLANQIVEALKTLNIISSVSVVGPGFINITLTETAVREEAQRVVNLKTVGTQYTGKKVLVEHSSPNLFKPFHIGHLMNNTVGESIVRLMQAGGAEVTTTSFPSDVSLGIAKALYIVEQDGGEEYLKSVSSPITYLGEAYTRGVKYYDDHSECHNEIKELTNKIFRGESELYEVCKKINIDYFIETTKALGSHFDSFIYESESGVRGKDIILNNIGKPFIESEGAIVYIPSEARKDINTTVFVNSEGNPTYGGKDIGLIDLKFEKYSPYTSIYITDNEQIPHFRTVFAAAEEVDDVWKDRISKSLHVPHGRMTFKGTKMSSRFGGVPLAEDIINSVIEEVQVRSSDRLAHLSDTDKNERFKQTALAAIKFAILRSKPGQNINFDPDTSLSFEGDSGPYVQYTHARCASLLRKGVAVVPICNTTAPLTTLERKLIQYEKVTKKAVEEFAPQHIVVYLFEMCQEFNRFYAETEILGGDNVEHKLWIVETTKTVIKKGLEMLAVSAPDEM